MMESRENRAFAYEMKFLIPAERASEVRSWARTQLQADPNAESGKGDTYRITSLYYDTLAFGVFYRAGSHGRAKYRIRRYNSSASVFLERKLRTHGTVTKRRTFVPLTDLERLRTPDPEWAGEWFRRRVDARGMSPRCQISYQRTALVGITDQGPIRLTIDDGVCATAVAAAAFRPISGCTPLLDNQSILEMKFRMAMPAVFKQIVQEFRLLSRPVSKYRLALPVLGLAQELAPSVTGNQEPATVYA